MFFLFKQQTAYYMRISDWSSDVCSSDLLNPDKAIFDRKGFNQWIVRDQVGHLVIQISHEFQMTRMAEKEGRPTIRFILCHRIADRTAWNFDSFHLPTQPSLESCYMIEDCSEDIPFPHKEIGRASCRER